MVQLSTAVQLIKAVCTAEMQRVGFSQKKNKSFFSATSFGSVTEVLRIETTQAITTKGIACRYVVASNRAQVVRSYTCVTTTQTIFPNPLSPAPIVIIERVSHFVTWHRASVSRYSALIRFSCASKTPPSPCSGLEIVCTAAPRCPVSFCPSSPSPFAEVSVPSNARPFNCLSCRSLWIGSDFVPGLHGFLRMCTHTP